MSTDWKIDDHYKYEIALPEASALVEALRAFGYGLETAIADLIDNSITAQAANIWIDFSWSGRSSSIAIRDDGKGMTADELKEAMRPGSRNPLDHRTPNDLGRFGLGLKTASFSQCRRIIAVTRKAGSDEAWRCWDLDYIRDTGEWRLITEETIRSWGEFKVPSLGRAGTVIVWQKLDHVVGEADADDEKAYHRFLEAIDHVRAHLGMVFHRFLEKRNGLKIWINDRPVESWDPFLKNENATQHLPVEQLRTPHGVVTVSPFILPHRSKISQEVHKSASGPRGWNAQQGMYVYRNERLLVPGDWLGLGFQKEEHYKLARIQVDIPNTMDADWQIDVKKSRARPPGPLRPDLKRIANLTREQAVQIYRHRGKVTARKNSAEQVFVWEQKTRHSKVFYAINKSHPVIQRLLNTPTPDTVRDAIKLIEETVPSAHIVITAAEKPDQMAAPLEGIAYGDFEGIVSSLFGSFLDSGCSAEDALDRICSIEPFNLYPEYLELYASKVRGEMK